MIAIKSVVQEVFIKNAKAIIRWQSSLMSSQKIGFIGDGNMSKAMCRSIVGKKLIDYSQVYVSSPYVKNLDIWKKMGAYTTTDNCEVALQCDIVFLAVKPHMLPQVIEGMSHNPRANDVKNKLFVSMLAGITLDELKKQLLPFKGSRIVRVMPNTPIIVGEGCSVYCPGPSCTENDLVVIKSILDATGLTQKAPEKMINAIAAISSSGPAFVYLFIEALSDGGVRMGLHREMATKMAAQTVMGAAKMVLKTDKHMGVLKDEVCSAGGMTIAGIHALEKGSVRGSIMNAVEAATNRAAELGKLK